jgi:hypothetical protein
MKPWQKRLVLEAQSHGGDSSDDLYSLICLSLPIGGQKPWLSCHCLLSKKEKEILLFKEIVKSSLDQNYVFR